MQAALNSMVASRICVFAARPRIRGQAIAITETTIVKTIITSISVKALRLYMGSSLDTGLATRSVSEEKAVASLTLRVTKLMASATEGRVVTRHPNPNRRLLAHRQRLRLLRRFAN